MKTLTLTPKTKALTSEAKAQLEVAMMNGQVIRLTKDMVEPVLQYCLPAIRGTENLDLFIHNVQDVIFHKYNSGDTDREVFAISFNRVYGMPCVTFVFQDEEEPVSEDNLRTGAYAFCYVLNLESDWCSEFGSCYFENYKRVG